MPSDLTSLMVGPSDISDTGARRHDTFVLSSLVFPPPALRVASRSLAASGAGTATEEKENNRRRRRLLSPPIPIRSVVGLPAPQSRSALGSPGDRALRKGRALAGGPITSRGRQ